MGRLDGLPDQVRQEIEIAIDATARNRGMRLNVAINKRDYARTIMVAGRQITE